MQVRACGARSRRKRTLAFADLLGGRREHDRGAPPDTVGAPVREGEVVTSGPAGRAAPTVRAGNEALHHEDVGEVGSELHRDIHARRRAAEVFHEEGFVQGLAAYRSPSLEAD